MPSDCVDSEGRLEGREGWGRAAATAAAAGRARLPSLPPAAGASAMVPSSLSRSQDASRARCRVMHSAQAQGPPRAFEAERLGGWVAL